MISPPIFSTLEIQCWNFQREEDTISSHKFVGSLGHWSGHSATCRHNLWNYLHIIGNFERNYLLHCHNRGQYLSSSDLNPNTRWPNFEGCRSTRRDLGIIWAALQDDKNAFNWLIFPLHLWSSSSITKSIRQKLTHSDSITSKLRTWNQCVPNRVLEFLSCEFIN